MESGSATKRRGWLLMKARELALRNDDQVGLIIFSSSGQMFKYCSPNSSMLQNIDRFKKASGTQIQEDDDKQQIYREMTRMKNENDKLQATIRQLTGEDLTTLTKTDLKNLQKQLEVSLDRVRSREIELLQEELREVRRQWRCILEAKFSRARGKETEKTEQSRDLLQLSPPFSNRLQPTQPNLQDPNLHHHSCSSGNLKKPKT
ncbi:MADS-box protein AeAP3-2-like isoform X2 [Nymphaea colorata]|uniref:MADS-box protein AeAP3-2-like isoform X2 n=1 Tax=Nymphaea colorata TaxID=210225 RepID=UPI00129DAA10|nr:MADS-box protein AeAP3-2-like isoform X2 [Nymphaea colorata]